MRRGKYPAKIKTKNKTRMQLACDFVCSFCTEARTT